VRCDYFDAALCRSCTLLGTPYVDQVARKERHCREVLGDPTGLGWLPPVRSADAGFRNKAKMVVAGTVEHPTLGILDPRGRGVDLRECGLHSPGLHDALPALADFVTVAALVPYDVAARRGELKHLLVTESPDGRLMVRFVLRSTEAVARIRKHLPLLRAAVPALRVASVNVQPAHKAVLEGEREILLTEEETLPMRLDGVTLHLRPQSFFQTNTAVAAALYRQVREWVEAAAPSSVWDLYCGVGGFALHLAGPGRAVVGVEVSPEAVASAELSAREAGLTGTTFRAGDATAFARAHAPGDAPDVVVVNPPRRGIGPDLAQWLEASSARHVVYSSCNAVSLARDLAAMPSLLPVQARLLDMFPQTDHYEVAVLLERHAGRTVSEGVG
jgi:23S rRNA (uracil747-C5)-methyltransferase